MKKKLKSLFNILKEKKISKLTFQNKQLYLETKKLILDDDVTKKTGIYRYILTRDEKYLSIRAFSENMKQKAYELQNALCVECGELFELSEMEADHIDPWSKGGKTIEENCQLLCQKDNRRKSGK